MLEIDAEDKSILMTLLARYLPNYAVWAFGSRVTGKARRFSDLDLVLKPKAEVAIPLEQLSELQEVLACSDISIIIDMHDWYAMPEHFRQTIADQGLLLLDN